MDEENKQSKKIKISKLKFFQISTIALAVVLVAMFTASITGFSVADVLGSGKSSVAEDTVSFLNENYGTNAVLVSSEKIEGVYKMTLLLDGEETYLYVSNGGSFIFPLAIETNPQSFEMESQQAQQTAQAPQTVKSEKPEVEVFIMSHCPYGTQIEKGILPVAELLGDKIDFEVKFVYYIMHGEVEATEQLVQYCIQEDFNEKYIDYLSCFLEDGDTDSCLDRTGIDKKTLEACTEKADNEFGITASLEDTDSWLSGRFPLFNVHKEENELYGVKGSPALVINGQQVSSARDSASLLTAVCSAFENPPAECDEALSSAPPAPGFGYERTGTDTTATCG